MAHTILITGGKGGVGKSTVCAILGRKLAEHGNNVLILETSRRSLDVLLGVSERVMLDLEDVLYLRCTPVQAALEVGQNLRLICAPQCDYDVPQEKCLKDLFDGISHCADYILIDADGESSEMLHVLALHCDTAVIVSTPDRVSVRDCRAVSDILASTGIGEIRLCINKLPSNFSKVRPVPDLDWMIDEVCAQLIAVVLYDDKLASIVEIGQVVKVSNDVDQIFDNFAQRIMGKHIDLSVR